MPSRFLKPGGVMPHRYLRYSPCLSISWRLPCWIIILRRSSFCNRNELRQNEHYAGKIKRQSKREWLLDFGESSKIKQSSDVFFKPDGNKRSVSKVAIVVNYFVSIYLNETFIVLTCLISSFFTLKSKDMTSNCFISLILILSG